MECPYVVKQEYGGRSNAEVVWAPAAGNDGVAGGLGVHVRSAVAAGAQQPGAQLGFDRVEHTVGGHVRLDIDAAHMGVGDNSWMLSVAPDHCIKNGVYKLALDLLPMGKADAHH